MKDKIEVLFIKERKRKIKREDVICYVKMEERKKERKKERIYLIKKKKE